jgi:hypothetical protein
LIALGILSGCGGDGGGHAADDAPAVSAESAAPAPTSGSPEFSAAGESSPPVAGERYALLIGIERYPTGGATLPGPATDVDELRDVLINVYKFPAQNVRTLRNQQATRQAIVDSIKKHLGRAGANGLAFLYFSGHGVRMSRNYSVQDHEATGVDQALFVWGANNKPSVILDDELGYLLRQISSARVIFVADACHSGTMSTLEADADGSGTVPPRFYNRSAGQLVNEAGADLPAQWLSDAAASGSTNIDVESGPFLFLAAAEEQRKAYSGNNWPTTGERHGVFTYYFTRALRTANGTHSARQFFSGLRTQVVDSDVCTKYKRCQTPQIGGEQADDRLVNLIGNK